VLAVVKKEGPKFLGGARAGRTLKVEERGAEVRKKSRRGKLDAGNGLFLGCRAARYGNDRGGSQAVSCSSLPGGGWVLHRGLSPLPKLSPSYAACREGTIAGSAATSCLLAAAQVGKRPAPAQPPSRCRFPARGQARSQPGHAARLRGRCRGGSSRAHGTARLGRGAQVRVSHSAR